MNTKNIKGINDTYIWYDVSAGVWRVFDLYEREYSSAELMLQGIEPSNRVFVADMKFAQHYLKHLRMTKIKARKGNYYSFRLENKEWISIDHIFRCPFVQLVKELELGKPRGKAVKEVVDIINDISKFKLGNDFYTIGGLAWKFLKSFTENPNYLKNTYPFKLQRYNFFTDKKHNKIYKGGLCLINRQYEGKVVENLYKYDVNSFFPWIMKCGKMPKGESRTCLGKPKVRIEDRLVHIKWTAVAKFDGLAPYEDLESFVEKDMWIWGCELLELMNWYDTIDIEWIEYRVFEKSERDDVFGAFVDFVFSKKKTETGARRRLYKLIMNNVYGKFGECPFVMANKQQNGEVQSKQSTYFNKDKLEEHSLAVASKITALARTELMRRIREATNNRPDIYYVYGDTDSMILTIPYDKVSDELGDFKFEGHFVKGKALGKKCYMLYDGNKFECHAAGVTRDGLEKEINELNWEEAEKRFNYNEEFECPIYQEGQIVFVKRKLSDGFNKFNLNQVYDIFEGE